MSVSGRKEDQAALETRALMYWNAALPLLEKMERQKTVRVYNTKLFEYYRLEISLYGVFGYTELQLQEGNLPESRGSLICFHEVDVSEL